MTGPPRLVGDIGATNARFALAGTDGSFGEVRVVACEEHPALGDAIAAYLEGRPPPRPREAALAIAGPVSGDRVALTNHPWAFSTEALRGRLDLERLLVINDFAANALGVPHLGEADRLQIGGGAALPHMPIAVIGPGSGLGVSALAPAAAGWLPIAGEGGHVTMAAASVRESVVLDLMRRRFDHVSAERVLSGPGLVNLYNALCEIDAVPALPYGPAQICDPATGESDPRCQEAVAMFCAMLGTIAGNLALTLGARGGVYVAGGIVPRLGAAFAASAFRERFEQKGRLAPYLAAIPTYVVTHPYPAFLGLAALLSD